MQFGGGSRSLLYTLQKDRLRMDSNPLSSGTVSQEEFKLFHAIDRELYTLLAIKLWRDPAESMQIIALLMWLESTGFPNVIKKMTSLPCILVNEIADEAVSCLNCIDTAMDTLQEMDMDIPLIQCLMEKEISLQFFHENRVHAKREIQRIAKQVCRRALADIMQQSIEERNRASRSQSSAAAAADQTVTQTQPQMNSILSFTASQFDQAASGFGRAGSAGGDHVVALPAEERTMFVTFSKGYPVYEWEVREFFTRAYGDCIESLQMQQVQPNEQSLFARIVFHSSSTIEVVLDGLSKAKFTINGKHVWMRKFVPKRTKTVL